MKNKPNAWVSALVIFIFCLILGSTGYAGETKNELIYDCNRPVDNAITCLACNIYHEARSEETPGMWLVALATKNRVDGTLYPINKGGPKVKKEKFTDSFCKVVYEQRLDKKYRKWVPMFSWTLDGKHDRVYNTAAWIDALELASKIVAWHNDKIEEDIVDVTFGCQWYHHVDIQPYWMKSNHPTIRIGAHQCYSLNEATYLDRLNKVLPALTLRGETLSNN